MFPFLLSLSIMFSPSYPPIVENTPLNPSPIMQSEYFSLDQLSEVIEEVTNYKTSFTISAAGDVTIGSDDSFGYYGTFHHEVDEAGLEHFGKNVTSIFENDDMTIVNLETTLTTSEQKAEKLFRFKGSPTYTEILNLTSVEAVNLANNHTFDYMQKGYEETIENLNKYSIDSFGYDRVYFKEIKGIKVGAIGYTGWYDSAEVREQMTKDIDYLKEQGAQIIIANFHWGEERHYHPNSAQQSLGRFAIDSGADLVLGHHPHVVQGIEEYNDKFIVYSLGNFMFGGNRNPSDKDTFVFQQTFHFSFNELTDEKYIKIIPASISSETNRNNYQPTPLEGEEAERVLTKILSLSDDITENSLSTADYFMEDSIAVFSEKDSY
ncbi:CapA family protein [Oceanobacillus salinisoli]|uniref:CapA family protein n=1 Tax=Oceanobacillus salinisoli TaxID=2678611 RepID=UPI0012E327B2|nr:CapA family protein [Oceanobacillus salinisoli]